MLTDGDDLALENLQRNLDHNNHLQIAQRTSVLKLQWLLTYDRARERERDES